MTPPIPSATQPAEQSPSGSGAPTFRLLRLRIRNYRNFRDVDCALGSHVVLFGENAAGKSNLIRALRLVLDPDLPDSERRLDADDFWHGIDPFRGNEVSVSIDFTGFEADAALLALLGDHLIEAPAGTPPVARITYRFAPKDTVTAEARPKTGRDDYDFSIYGRDDPADEIDRQVRRYLVLRVLGALRDAEADLRTWRRSPLRPLLEALEGQLDADGLKSVASKIDAAATEIMVQKPLAAIGKQIGSRLTQIIGSQHDLDPTLGFASTDPAKLLQALRLFTDKRLRQLSETSLGHANVIYLALILLHAESQERDHEHAALLLAIEEPEAHLHPQLQRSIFRDLLTRSRPIVVSTHSPNIASVTPLEALVLVRTNGKDSSLVPFSSAEGFSPSERADLQRYIDVTRAEILFARGVVLVEGDAEKYVVPTAARLIHPEMSLDQLGISVCSVAGTDFLPYTKFLGALGIPCVVVTDGDPGPVTGAVPDGLLRAKRLLTATGKETAGLDGHLAAVDYVAAVSGLMSQGIFVGTRTLESDLASSGAGDRMAAAFHEISPEARETTLLPFRVSGALTDEQDRALIALIERVGKGRFAQRLCDHLTVGDIPAYLANAINTIIAAVTRPSAV